MAPIAIFFGVLLSVLGPVLYFLSDAQRQSPTMFIPTGFGVALILCGVLAMKEKFRMHAMHVAALLGLVGFAIPAFRVVKEKIDKGSEFEFTLSMQGQTAMAVLCLLFLLLCIRSFILVRMARKRKEADASLPT